MTSGRSFVATGLLGVIVGASATAGCWWWRASNQAPALPASSAAVVDELRRETARLRAVLAATKASTAVMAIRGAAVEARVEEQRECPPPAVVEHDAGSEPVRLSTEELLGRIEEQFRSEGTDSAWNAQAEVMARRELSPFATEGPGRVQLECRASMCRAEITYRDAAEYNRVTGSVSADTSEWRGGRTTSPPRTTAEGTIVVAHYLFRDGTDPPRDIYAEEEAHVAAASHRP